MKRYYVKSRTGRNEYLDILSENDDGYMIRLTRISDGNEKITEINIPRHLFMLCIKTGYISEYKTAA